MTDPAAVALTHNKYMSAVASRYPTVKIGAPSVTNGLQSNNGTTMGIEYLKLFLAACVDCKIDFVNAHWYDQGGNITDFKQHLREIYQVTGKPIWVTEFAPLDDMVKPHFLSEVLPWLDDQDWIRRYAYSLVTPGSLINSEGTGLSTLGDIYQNA
jgi:hypothetical protein